MIPEQVAIGLDVGKGGWAMVELATDPRHQGIAAAATCLPFGSHPPHIGADTVVIIDAPIGLLDNDDASPSDKGKSGDREVDKAARKWCSSTSSVFPAPTRQQLGSAIEEHRRAAAAGRRRRLANVEPGGISQQTFELAPAIEAARVLGLARPGHVFEAHPEVIFAALAEGVMPLAKLSLAGALARAGVLRKRLRMDVLDWVIRQESSTGVAADNWLDALAMALVAMDWAQGNRFVLKKRGGLVQPWTSETGGIMALPITPLRSPPPRLGREDAVQLALDHRR